MLSDKCILALENINVTMSKGTKLARKILNNISVQVSEGDFIVIIGENGAGKSTIFNIISGLLKPDSGKIIIDGQDAVDMKQMQRAALISKVMQDPKASTMENMTIFENMSFAFLRGQRRRLHAFASNSRRELFREKLRMLNIGLEDRMNELVSDLSGGQRQALGLLMAILAESKILLLDEITAALDPSSSKYIMQLTDQVSKEEKLTCIMITHNMMHSVKYGNRLLLLKNGSFVAEYDHEAKAKLTQRELTSHFEEI